MSTLRIQRTRDVFQAINGPNSTGSAYAEPARMKLKSYRDLKVWQLSMRLAEDIYTIVKKFPLDERFGLSLQLRKAGVSIPSNIAEGSNYGTHRRYIHHLRVACGSEGELQTQLELSERLKFASPSDVRRALNDASEVGRMLNGLIRSLDQRPDP